MVDNYATIQSDGRFNNRPKTQRDGCGMSMNVLGITLEHFEKSRAGKVNCINHKVPNQRLNNLKSDSKRRKSFEKNQNLLNSMNSNQPKDFYDRNEKEFFDILKRIERLKNHKMKANQDQAAAQASALAADASKTAINAVEERL